MIPKASGKLRALGIPTVADRVVQAALKLVLEPIFEADFAPVSYGFRPNRRAQDAIAEIHHFSAPQSLSSGCWRPTSRRVWMWHHTAPRSDVVVRTGRPRGREPLFVSLFFVRLGRGLPRVRRA